MSHSTPSESQPQRAAAAAASEGATVAQSLRPSSKKLNNDYDAEVAAVIQTYSEGRRSPCTSCSSGAKPGPGVPVAMAGHDGVFLMQVDDAQSTTPSGLLRALATDGSDVYVPAAAMMTPYGEGGAHTDDAHDRRNSLFADALQIARERDDDVSPVTDMLAMQSGGTQRPHTYAAGAEREMSYMYSHGAATHVAGDRPSVKPHRAYGPEELKRLLEAKEQRQRDEQAAATAAAAAAAVSDPNLTTTAAPDPSARHSQSTSATPKRVAPHAGASASSSFVVPASHTYSHPHPHNPRQQQQQQYSQTSYASFVCQDGASSISGTPERMPRGAHADLSPAQLWAPQSATTTATTAPVYYSTPSAPQSQSPPQPISPPPSMPNFAQPPAAAAAAALQAEMMRASAQEHYRMYMWSCAMYYEQCMAGAVGGAAMGPPPAMMELPGAVGSAVSPWTGGGPVALLPSTYGAPGSLPPGFLPPQSLSASVPAPPTSLVSVLPVQPAATLAGIVSAADPHGASAGESNDSSAMNMNYVAPLSVNSIPDPDASVHAHVSQTGGRPSRSRGHRGGGGRSHAGDVKQAATSRPGASLSSSSATGAGRRRRKSAAVVPPEMRYSQTNPFSTYEHNKKLVTSATTALVE